METFVRKLRLSDFPGMVSLENSAWPTGARASKAKLLDRLETFGEGFLGIFEGSELFGMASSQLVLFSADEPVSTWTRLTADGWISRTHNSNGNCLHFVSICVHPRARGRGFGTMLNQGRLEIANALKCTYALTDTRLPGLRQFCLNHPEKGAQVYLEEILKGQRCQPVVNMYLSLGFVPCGLIPRCMESDKESAGYGLAMLKRLKEQPE